MLIYYYTFIIHLYCTHILSYLGYTKMVQRILPCTFNSTAASNSFKSPSCVKPSPIHSSCTFQFCSKADYSLHLLLLKTPQPTTPNKTKKSISQSIDSKFQEENLQSYPDTELLEYIRASPRLQDDWRCHIWILSPNLLAKSYYGDQWRDANVAMTVAHKLGIRVPTFKRTVMKRNGAFCIMECIPGMTLETAWTSLSWIRTINLALQLRRYVSHLRSMTSLTAGSLATGKFRSFWFQDLFGLPVRSGLEIVADFIKFWAEFVSIPQEVKGRGPDHPKRYVPPTPEKFVLIHHDLAPRNILVDPFESALVAGLG